MRVTRPTLVSAAYVRVSSKAQTLDMQRDAIQRAAAARRDPITTWYAEKQSARTIERTALARLRADARAGAFQRLYVFRLDRLARSGIRDTLEVVEDLRAAGVELVTVSDGFSLDGPSADIILAVMAWAAKMERLAINERISAARTRLAAEGRPWGRPPVTNARERARILELHRGGSSVRTIAMTLKIGRSAVWRVLQASRKGGRDGHPLNPTPVARLQGRARK